MNKGMLTVGIILLAVTALLIINVLTNFSTGGEFDYYLLKETTDAAMEDSIDWAFYRKHQLYRIEKDKFVESFLKRFANSVDTTRNYNIKFYDINEVPPKVSVKVDSLTVLSFNKEAASIEASVDSIIESNNIVDPFTNNLLERYDQS